MHSDQKIGALRITELVTSRADAHLKALPASAGKFTRIILGACTGSPHDTTL